MTPRARSSRTYPTGEVVSTTVTRSSSRIVRPLGLAAGVAIAAWRRAPRDWRDPYYDAERFSVFAFWWLLLSHLSLEK